MRLDFAALAEIVDANAARAISIAGGPMAATASARSDSILDSIEKV